MWRPRVPDEIDSLFPDLQGLLNADWGNSPGSPLTADPEHGGVSAESLDAYLRENAGRPLIRGVGTSGGGTTVPQPPVVEVPPPSPGEGDEEEEPEAEPPLGEPPAPPPSPTEVPDAITVGDQVFTREQLEAFARFRSDLDRDARLQELLTAYYTGQLPQPAAPAAPPVPTAPSAYVPSAQAPPLGQLLSFTEDDDPRFVQLMQVVQAQQQQIAQLAQATENVAQSNVARSNADMQALVDRAANSFKEQHSLTDEEIQRLRLSASRMNSMESLMRGFDPITGAPQRPDILAATDRALEIAYYADPQLRQRMIDEAIAANRERNRHRQKLAGVGGSSGSVSRTPQEAPRPGSQASHNAMVEEVGQMLSGTWSEPGR
jgi:hypothetical protein